MQRSSNRHPYVAALLVLLAGCSDLRCTDEGECRNVDIDELYCPALSSPFEDACDGVPRDLHVGDVLDSDGLPALARVDVLTRLAGEDPALQAEWVAAAFDRRAEAVPSQEFDCGESVGAVVDKIGLDLKASAVRHIEVDVRPVFCDATSGDCANEAESASPYIETLRWNAAADEYVAAVLELLSDEDPTDLRFVSAAFVGNVVMVLEAESGFAGKVDIPVGESVQLGLTVDVSEDREIRLTTGSPAGPFGFALSHTDIAVTDL